MPALERKRKTKSDEEIEEASQTKMTNKKKKLKTNNNKENTKSQDANKIEETPVKDVVIEATTPQMPTLKELSWADKVAQEMEALKDVTNTYTARSSTLFTSEKTTTNRITDINTEDVSPNQSQAMVVEENTDKAQDTLSDEGPTLTERATTNGGPALNPTMKWSSLFPKLKSGQSTYSSFTPGRSIRSNNNNALIVDVQGLQLSFNEIMTSMFEHVKYDVSAAKQHFTKGKRSHLELTFVNAETRRYYATHGINIENKTYYGYVPTDGRKTFLPIKCRNVPLGNKLDISDALQRAFEDVGKIASIKPLLIDGTPYATDQWIIVFETTNDPELENNIPWFTYVMDNKVTTEWRTASKLCYFCEKTGHIKKECPQFLAAVEQRNRLRERKWAGLSGDPETKQVQTDRGNDNQELRQVGPEEEPAGEDQNMGEAQEQVITEQPDDMTNLESNTTAILPMAEVVTATQEQVNIEPAVVVIEKGNNPPLVLHPQDSLDPIGSEASTVAHKTPEADTDMEGFTTVSYQKQSTKKHEKTPYRSYARGAPYSNQKGYGATRHL